ncbi:MAG: 4Fe-4S binding protein [Thermoguttaceae bacterium]|nr:4Fe-4S binding protein [Thermoguttaceae bacterium]
MAATVDKDACVGCGACVDTCPCSCIEIKDDKACVGDDCASCGACADACPAGAITVE